VAFPLTPLPLLVDIAPGAKPADTLDNWDGLWTNVTADVRVEQGIQIEQGKPDEASQTDPGKCTLVFNNRSGNYNPRNPTGAYYGLLKKNTPLRVRLQRLTETFTRTAASGSGWGTSDNGIAWSSINVAFSVNGSQGVVTFPAANFTATSVATNAGGWDFDMYGTTSVSAISAGADWVQYVNFRRGTGSANQYQFVMDFTGTVVNLQLYRTLLNSTTVVSGAFGPSYAANQQFRFRLKAEGGFVGAKFWSVAGTEPAAWMVSSSNEGVATLDNTSLGTNLALQSFRQSGNTSTTSATWDDLDIKTTLFMGTVAEWPVRWDKSGNDSTAPVQASGVIRRLQQGQAELNSPLYRTIYGQTPPPPAYWPLEDESGSTSAVGVGLGVKPASVYSASFGFDTTVDPQLLGASSTMEINQDTTISGVVPTMNLNTSQAWLLLMAIYTPAWPPGGAIAVPMQIRCSGTASLWQLQFTSLSSGQLYPVAFDADRNVIANITTGGGNFTPGAWHILQLESYQNGASVTNIFRTWNLSTGAQGGAVGSYTGTLGQPNSWSIYGDSTKWPTGSVGHIAFYDRRGIFSLAQVQGAGQGYAGETAPDRVARLCTEQNVRIDVVAGTNDTLMGPQTSETFVSLLQETERTDLGLLSEFNGGLRYRSRQRRYFQTPRLALDFNQGHVAEPPEPTDDDKDLRNDWTVSRKSGSSARVTDDVSIADVGRYDDSVEINPYSDATLVDQAAFRVYLGTYNDLRWPSIKLRLNHNPELIEKFLALEVGSAITVANPPASLPVGTLRLLVDGWTQVLTPYGWDVELTCSSANPWRIPGSDDAVASRLDSTVSTLGSSVTSTGTSLSVTRPAGSAPWSTTDVPFDILVSGEQMTVTSISGTGIPQAFTVTRSVNGTVKAHSAGEFLTLNQPMYVAL
jgi:hypothetical protein